MAYDYNLCVKAAKSPDIKMWLIVAQYYRESGNAAQVDNPGLRNYILNYHFSTTKHLKT